jgi:hypothetical protein
MPLEDINRIEDVVLLFDQVWANEDTIGEKDFFEFIKRANRDLTSEQRFVILTITINALRGDI